MSFHTTHTGYNINLLDTYRQRHHTRHSSTRWKWMVPMPRRAQTVVPESVPEPERVQAQARCTTRISYNTRNHNKLMSFHTTYTGYNMNLLDTYRQKHHTHHSTTRWKWTQRLCPTHTNRGTGDQKPHQPHKKTTANLRSL